MGAVGLILVFACVFGVYVAEGNSMEMIIEAAPGEIATILGAAIGALILSNSMTIVKGVGSGIGKVFKGSKYKKDDFLQTMFLVNKLMKMLKSEGAVALEPHIENPESSAIFSEYPAILHDHDLLPLVTDTLRLLVVSSGNVSPYAVEEVMDHAIKHHHHAALKPAEALAGMAGALPALGIVACVLGVVKTMGAIDQPPSVLGGLVGAALVGTFLGVLMAYGIVEPFSMRLKQVVDEEGEIQRVVKQIIIGNLHGHPPPLIIEAARVSINHDCQPTFAEVFDGMRGK